jgi:hypothetical protein
VCGTECYILISKWEIVVYKISHKNMHIKTTTYFVKTGKTINEVKLVRIVGLKLRQPVFVSKKK